MNYTMDYVQSFHLCFLTGIAHSAMLGLFVFLHGSEIILKRTVFSTHKLSHCIYMCVSCILKVENNLCMIDHKDGT